MKREILIQCVELQLGQKNVLMEDRFYEDLAAESIDMVNLIVTIEEQTGLFIPEDKLPEFKTVQDLYNYIISHK
jgi:acyl carrier protein